MSSRAETAANCVEDLEAEVGCTMNKDRDGKRELTCIIKSKRQTVVPGHKEAKPSSLRIWQGDQIKMIVF